MNIVYHPASWARNWPKGHKPYATRERAVAHGHTAESLIETNYNGPASGVVTEPPRPKVTIAEAKEAVAEASGVEPEETPAPKVKKNASKKKG